MAHASNQHQLKTGSNMNSRLEGFWYALQHPLGPSRELGTYANHQESVDKLIKEMNARVHPDQTSGAALKD
jgi:hypothetical protein